MTTGPRLLHRGILPDSTPAPMPYDQRPQVEIENEKLRLMLLPGGGHIAAITLKENGVNPLWDPPWETIDPSTFDAEIHDGYGDPAEARLLSGIAGHNLCFDFFGPPSEQELAAGLTAHGETSVLDWDVVARDGELSAQVELPRTQMSFERHIVAPPNANYVKVTETATNNTDIDRAVGWTQHATLGPPFLEKGKTLFEASATKSKVFEQEFAPGHDRFVMAAEFEWPTAPLSIGGRGDMRLTVKTDVSGAFTAHLMDPSLEEAFFSAYHPDTQTLFGYLWKRSDFPWLGIWEENNSRQQSPWNGRTLTRGMEFGVSPMPETRRQAISRGQLFGNPTFRWIPARESVTVEYLIFIARADVELVTGFDTFAMLDHVKTFVSDAAPPAEGPDPPAEDAA